MKLAQLVATVILIVSSCPSLARADDWPTYRHDVARSGATAESLHMPLERQWTYSAAAAPNRAWSGPEGRTVEGNDLYDRVKFDDAIQVAVVGDRVFFGSSVDHVVYCLDASLGSVVWRFFTDAPIRLAPTIADGRVYVGSDDGQVYCLDASDGRLVWKYRVGPANEWIIGRGEMISRWPVRTSVLVDGGVAYFGAGVFPHENVYLCAANAADGTIAWRNDHISHQDAGRNDLSPQGYLLATADRLFVPSGRAQIRSADRKSGNLTGAGAAALLLSTGKVAGTEGIVIDGRLITPSLGSQVAGAGDATYVVTGGAVARMDRTKYGQVSNSRKVLQDELRRLAGDYRGGDIDEAQYKEQADAVRKLLKDLDDKGVVWRTPCSAGAAVIVAGDHVIAGGTGEVLAFRADNGELVWQAKVDGEARGLAAAGGNLLVSTTSGKIYCFSGEAPPAEDTNVADTDPFANDAWTAAYQAAAEQIIAQPNASRGFCLVLGSENGRLAYELAKRSQLKIYGIEPDAKKVEDSRRALSRAGLYGHRVTIHQGDLNDVHLPSYFANLIVSDTHLRTGKLDADPTKIVRMLKPAGGVAWLGQPKNAPGDKATIDTMSDWLARLQLEDRGPIKTTDTSAMLTRGTLPGAGNWTHQYAEPGNTANSGDKLVGGGLGVLWYGDPGPGMMVNRHQGAVGPLVVNGRLFVQGTDKLMAYDAYNGLPLWEVPNPKAIRTGVFQNRTPGNLAASGDRLFHMVRDTVFEHDAATGEVKAEHKLPPSVDAKTHEWGYLAIRDGRLIGTATTRAVIELERRRRGDPGQTATDAIFAIDIASGRHLWIYQGKSIDFQTIALGPKQVNFIDSSVTSEQRAAILAEDKTELQKLTGEAQKRAEERMKNIDVRLAVALDAATGQTIWSKPVDVTDCSEIGIGGGKLTLMYHNDVLILCGANANGHYWKQFVAGEFSRRRIVALRASDGYRLWAKDANYRHRPIIVGERVYAEPWAFHLTSGEQITRQHPLTGEQVPWSIMRPGHHCGMLTACDNLLLFRSGYTGFYDLAADTGTRHFAGHRLGCWINAIPTNGLVVIPEASAGCICMFSIASTIVLEPRQARRPWSLVSAVGSTTPVLHMALNLGAPGDRRDAEGRLWLAWPRPVPNPNLETSLDLKLKIETAFAPGGGFFNHDGDGEDAVDRSWIASSGGRGLVRLSIPLLGKGDTAREYDVRLDFNTATAPPAPLNVRMQDKTVAENVDLTSVGAASPPIYAVEAKHVAVADNLVIELSAADPAQAKSLAQLVLSGIEIVQSE